MRQSQQLSSALPSACDFKSHFCKQCGPRSDCSFRSSLIWVHTVCRYAKNSFEKFARIFSRRHKQTTFSDAVFLGALRVKYSFLLIVEPQTSAVSTPVRLTSASLNGETVHILTTDPISGGKNTCLCHRLDSVRMSQPLWLSQMHVQHVIRSSRVGSLLDRAGKIVPWRF